MPDRNIIFISHATPEDNEFSIWLASRLKSLGYSVWIDKKALIGGEKFWREIDRTIRHKAIKILLVYSENICVEPGCLKDGIEKELSLAESISKKEHINDYIILMNIDGADYNLFIGADRLNQIPFKNNWAKGFNLLLDKLTKDNIPKSEKPESIEFTNWFENKYVIKSGIKPLSELYYSSLWRINTIPDKFYLYQFESEQEANIVYGSCLDYPTSKISNVIASFSNNIPLTINYSNCIYNARLKEKFYVDTRTVIENKLERSDLFPTSRDSANHLKTLLSKVFHLMMKQKNLKSYMLANKNLAYYHTPHSSGVSFIEFNYPFRAETRSQKKRKKLLGRYKNLGFWHYAISCRPIFEPFIGFSLKSHIIFTTNMYKVWEDKDKIHSHRRSKGRLFFNAVWRDLELGFLHSLLDSDNEIKIALNDSFIMYMSPLPEIYWADFGYIEPKTKERFDILYSQEEEDINE